MDTEILGFGQVLWDLSAFVDFEFIQKLEMPVGGHRLIDKKTLRSILKKLEAKNITVVKNPGGSTANVMSNLGKLGTKSSFCGKHGKDTDGNEYMAILAKDGVKTHSVLDTKQATGQLLSLITPDKDRTFIVFRGASEVLNSDEVNQKLIKAAPMVHVEGYLIINSEEALWKIFEESTNLCFDLAAYSIIEQTRTLLQKMMQKHPPTILFANVFEGKAFTKKEAIADVIDEMLRFSQVAVLTHGEEGVLVKTAEGEEHFEPAIKSAVIDTTGAGDSFSAGFLHSYRKNKDIQKAAALGVRTSSITIRELGARSFTVKQLDKKFQKSL